MRISMKPLIVVFLSISAITSATGPAYAAPLYFPHIATTDSWQTEIAVINTSQDQSVSGILRAFDDDGRPVGTKNIALAGRGRFQFNVAGRFDNHANISYMVFDTDSDKIQGYTKFYREGCCRAAIPAVRGVSAANIHIPHIVSNAEWWTGISLMNTTSGATMLPVSGNNLQAREFTLGANAHGAFDIAGLFDGQPQPEIQAGWISGADGIVGLELFGKNGDGPRLDGVLITDRIFATLYFPHVADDGWRTEIAIYNPLSKANTITITPYSGEGTTLAPVTRSLAAQEKFIGTISDLGLPAGTGWFRIDSVQGITGLEIFGTADGKGIAAYAGGDEAGAKEGLFPKIEKSGWTGIAFVNTEDTEASVTMTACNDHGTAIATRTLTVGGHAKKAGPAEALFPEDISGATYIAYASDRKLVGFQINGSADCTMLDALPALVQGGLPAPVWQQTAGPEGGGISCLAIDPSNHQIVYAGTYVGIFKTTDGGASWTKIYTDLTNYGIISLAVDPTDSRIVYAGTNGGGILKTADGGASWSVINTGLTNHLMVNSLAIDPADSRIVYAGTGGAGGGGGGATGSSDAVAGGIFKTTDGGVSWSEIHTGLTISQVSSLVIDPSNSQVLYAGFGSGGDGVLKTTDGGVSWTTVFPANTTKFLSSLAIDPSNSQVVYAGYGGIDGSGILKTTDGGASWMEIDIVSTRSNVRSIVIDPSNSLVVYAGYFNSSGGGIYKTTDGGASWTEINAGLANQYVESLILDPVNNLTVYAGTNGGVFRTTNGGASWTARNNGIISTIVRSLVIDPENHQVVYAGTSVSGVSKTADGGASWTTINSGITNIGSQINSLAIDPANSKIVYAAGGFNSVFKTINGGITWSAINNGLPIIHRFLALAIDPSDSRIVYVATAGDGVYKTIDSGASWTAVNAGLTYSSVSSLAIDPENTQIVYAGAAHYTGAGGVFKTTNGGASWTEINSGPTNQAVESLAIDPANNQIVYAGTSGVFKTTDGGTSWTEMNTVYKTTDGGASWMEMNTGLTKKSILFLAVDPSNSQVVYALGGRGVFRTVNGGVSWSAVNAGLTNQYVHSLVIDPENNKIVYVGTNEGVFRTVE